MKLSQNLTDLPPDTSCQTNKYQSFTDILNLLGLGVKVSSTSVEFFGLSKTSNYMINHYAAQAFRCDRILKNLSSAKTGRLHNINISQSS